jgi:lipopolysaccharide transport system permease protein
MCLLLFIIVMGYPFTPTWLALPVLILAQVLFIAACALAAAAITPFLPDFRFIISTVMTMLMFASGIFYDYKQVLLEEHKELFLLNPMARLIEGYRDALIRQDWPDWSGIAWILVGSAVALLLMFRFYRRHGAVYARLVIQ